MYVLQHRVSKREYGLCVTEIQTCGRIVYIMLFTGTKFISMEVES